VSTWAAILAGGFGTRFWPLSTPEQPKQFLPLAGNRPLLAQAVSRLQGLVPPERTLILTGPSLVERVANGVDAESVAAMLPSAIKQMAQLGDAGSRGDFTTAVLEFGRGLAIVAVLNAEALLIVLVQPATNVGALLFDLRRHRSAIAGLL